MHSKNTPENCNFFSLLTGGSIHASVTKKEVIFVVVFKPTPPKTNEIKVEIISWFSWSCNSQFLRYYLCYRFLNLFPLKIVVPNLLVLALKCMNLGLVVFVLKIHQVCMYCSLFTLHSNITYVMVNFLDMYISWLFWFSCFKYIHIAYAFDCHCAVCFFYFSLSN